MIETKVLFREGELSASVHGQGPTVLVLGHGAGGTRRTLSLVGLAETLGASGRCVLLFNFPYADKGVSAAPIHPRSWKQRCGLQPLMPVMH